VAARLVARSLAWRPAVGLEALVGGIGRAKSALDPVGMVWIEGALWEATAEDRPIAAGERIQVTGMDGLHLRVRAVQDAAMGPVR
jgi:membrane-bound serine protease (ClpP class)